MDKYNSDSDYYLESDYSDEGYEGFSSDDEEEENDEEDRKSKVVI